MRPVWSRLKRYAPSKRGYTQIVDFIPSVVYFCPQGKNTQQRRKVPCCRRLELPSELVEEQAQTAFYIRPKIKGKSHGRHSIGTCLQNLSHWCGRNPGAQ